METGVKEEYNTGCQNRGLHTYTRTNTKGRQNNEEKKNNNSRHISNVIILGYTKYIRFIIIRRAKARSRYFLGTDEEKERKSTNGCLRSSLTLRPRCIYNSNSDGNNVSLLSKRHGIDIVIFFIYRFNII